MSNPIVASREKFSLHHPEVIQQINGRKWGVIQVGGTGPALVLLPGTLGRADIFWNQIESLAGHARVLSLSYPETGNLQDWCVDIAALMQEHGMVSATILGSSLGGYVAMYFAATKPEMTDNLIAANTLPSVAGIKDKPPYSADLTTLSKADLIQGFSNSLTGWVMDQPHRSDVVELLMMEVFGRIPDAELRARIAALRDAPELPAITLNQSQIYTIESLDDRLIPSEVRDAVRALLDPIRSISFENGSHFPYITEAEAYSTMIAEVLELS